MVLSYDPKVLGKLEIGWWMAHNEKNKSELMRLLVEQNMAMYGLSVDDAGEALKFLAGGVGYHDSREWEKAVNSIVGYYEVIKRNTLLSFDTRVIAELEVGWWRLHDELEYNPDKSKLAISFAKLYATEFGLDSNQLLEAGKMRAEATREHDLAEDVNTPAGEVSNHWKLAEDNLVSFYTELKRVVNG